MDIGILLAAIASLILIGVGIAHFVSLKFDEGGLSGIFMTFMGIIILCCVVSIPTSEWYGTKVLKHEYDVQYTNKVNSKNQIVSTDTVIIWK